VEVPVASDRRGLTLIELIVAMACGLLVLQLTVRGVLHTRRIGADMRERSDRLVALRSARSVLRRELRAGRAGTDWRVYPPDSVKLRAFRGAAWVCPGVDHGVPLLVAWRGVRQPDPEKDSVLLLDDAGYWSAAELTASSRTPERCPAAPTVTVMGWEVSPPPTGTPVLARLFESGSYHIADGALRYRRGAGGRQPLTAPVLRTPPSGLELAGTSISLHLLADADPEWSWAGYLAGVGGGDGR
jgi:prepilin-type N-terminal cleavage/methylation domain-containing protein